MRASWQSQAGSWQAWLRDEALPLWSGRGFEAQKGPAHKLSGLFYEQLGFDHFPVKSLNRRLMVQARQIATFCLASMDRLLPPSSLVSGDTVLEHVRSLYHRRDGRPGWVFSLSPDGEIADARRDLYAHAFILYAHAVVAMAMPQGRTSLRDQALLCLNEIEDIFSDPKYGGYFDTAEKLPAKRQNPHMHLLEALLASYKIFGDAVFAEKSQSLLTLLPARLIDPESGMLREFFDREWRVIKPHGENEVEPGHLFEWSWLLEEAITLDIAPEHILRPLAERLFSQAWCYGVDHEKALVWDRIVESGRVDSRNTRLWPQTELMRLLCRRRDAGRLTQLEGDFLLRHSQQFREVFIPPEQKGGWIDWRDGQGACLVKTIPASSFYHIYGAVRCFALTAP